MIAKLNHLWSSFLPSKELKSGPWWKLPPATRDDTLIGFTSEDPTLAPSRIGSVFQRIPTILRDSQPNALMSSNVLSGWCQKMNGTWNFSATKHGYITMGVSTELFIRFVFATIPLERTNPNSLSCSVAHQTDHSCKHRTPLTLARQTHFCRTRRRH